MDDGNVVARKRSTRDLIDELDAESVRSMLAAIGVGFATKTSFVFVADVNRLLLLTALVRNKGMPLGIVGLRHTAEGARFYCRPFREFAGVTWVHHHLTGLAEVVLAVYQRKLHPALFSPRNN
jgi:hypothetical protein